MDRLVARLFTAKAKALIQEGTDDMAAEELSCSLWSVF